MTTFQKARTRQPQTKHQNKFFPKHQKRRISKNRGVPPKSSILIGFSIINHPFWGKHPIFGNTHIEAYPAHHSHHTTHPTVSLPSNEDQALNSETFTTMAFLGSRARQKPPKNGGVLGGSFRQPGSPRCWWFLLLFLFVVLASFFHFSWTGKKNNDETKDSEMIRNGNPFLVVERLLHICSGRERERVAFWLQPAFSNRCFCMTISC